ncbi:MAG: sigma-70 family RNA polymerase sigma factor [Rhodobacteraceae bacterium]|jgi:RNA polymerase sigma-70 factor (ECF subfamily)|nr:sigma-70 family RNA polymerase sigma factor [Paracoccaceae bacterium]
MLHSVSELERMKPAASPLPGGAPRQHRNRGQAALAQDDENGRLVAQMLAIANQQDEAAFAALFAHFAPRIKGFLMKSGAPAAQAEDCAQDVMATVWRKAAMFDPTRANVSTWIFTIARNRRIDLLRRERRPEPEDLPWGPEPERDQADAMVLQQETDRLGEALSALPREQRDLIEQAYFGDLSHGEIAQITGLPLGTIKSRIRLAITKLRQAMT